MMVKNGVERKWLAIAAAAYLLIMVDLLPSPTNASLLPAQHVPDAPGGSEEGKTGLPRQAIGGGFKLKGAISLDSYVDFGKKKKKKAVESRSLRESPIVSPPSPHPNIRHSHDVLAPPGVPI
ncbi:uncharacterized protein LOC115678782 [Syzygium oleosum]|uniref:uncharacterized protein LOC115678782 n=1 Tax=Syzygium oleosum TaxID=219896 RepID=UPI0011D1BA03|nr:uncharacterized protein LOC115678782 [Syzygium oleosum]